MVIHLSTGPHTLRPVLDRTACGRLVPTERTTTEVDEVTCCACRRTHTYRSLWREWNAWRWETFRPTPGAPGWLLSLAPRAVVRDLAGQPGIAAGAVFDVDLGRRLGVRRRAVVAVPSARTRDVRWYEADLGPAAMPVDLLVSPLT